MAFFNPQHHPLVPRNVIDENQSARLSHLLSETTSSFAVLTPQTRSDAYSDVEWIVFSPHMSSAEDYTEDSIASVALEQEELPVAGAQTPLAFPTHNGTGSFISPSPVDIAERVNAWRIDQSSFVLQELQRLFGDIEPENLESQQQFYEEHVSNVPKPKSIWENLRKKVLEDFIGINDQVMQLLFGEIDWHDETQIPQVLKDDGQQELESTVDDNLHFSNALKHGPPHWDTTLVSGILSKLDIPSSATEMSLLRFITSSLIEHYNKQRRDRLDREVKTAVPSPAHSVYWNEGSYSSSNYWETGSINSTAVW